MKKSLVFILPISVAVIVIVLIFRNLTILNTDRNIRIYSGLGKLTPAPSYISATIHKSYDKNFFHASPTASYTPYNTSPSQIVNHQEVTSRTNLKNGLTATMIDDKTIAVFSSLPDGSILMTKFDKKYWGTWNIGGWFLVGSTDNPLKNSKLLAGGGTDWEYVFRVTRKAGSVYQFSGGNHVNEVLRSLKIYNNITGDELTLKPGEKTELDSLRIVEETYLTIDNKSSYKYAAVERNYVIAPSKITLQTDFDFIDDIYMGTSYICMFPTSKTCGRYVKFSGSGNVYETPKYGSTLTTPEFENFIGKEKTTEVEIWGTSNNGYNFSVGIANEEMADFFQNKLKVFYWDFNERTNKLYFSKYDNESYNLITKGTKWSNYAFWELKFNR